MEEPQYLHCLGSFEGYFEPLKKFLDQNFFKGEIYEEKVGIFRAVGDFMFRA